MQVSLVGIEKIKQRIEEDGRLGARWDGLLRGVDTSEEGGKIPSIKKHLI